LSKITLHIILGLILIFSSCAKKQTSIFLSKEKAKEANDQFFKGIEFKNNAKWEQSVKAFEDYLLILPNEAAAHYEVARIQREQLLIPELALMHAKRAVEIDKNNKWYGLEYARCLGANNQWSQSSKQYQTLIKQDPAWTLPLLELSETCSKNGELRQAIEALDQLEKVNGIDPYISHLKQELYIQLKDLDAAGLELEKLALAFPEETNFTMQAVEFYLGTNANQKALNLINKNPHTPESQKAFLQYKILSKDPKAHPQDILLTLDKALDMPGIGIDQRINALAPFVYSENIQEEWKAVIARCIEKTLIAFPREAKAHSLAGDFYALNNNSTKAIESYINTVQLDPSKKVVWSALLGIYELEDTLSPTEYYDLAQEAYNLFPFAAEFRKMAAQALFRLGELQTCIEECNAGLAIVLDDPNVESELHLMKVFCFAALGDKKNANAQGESMMKKKNIMAASSVIQLGWMNEFFGLQIPNIQEQMIVLINNQMAGSNIALHAYQLRKGERIVESEFDKNSFFDALNAAKYFTEKKDNITACKFLTEAKKKMPFNNWLNQINPECP
jgi:tetratricopeptide (TPR) repeat protein